MRFIHHGMLILHTLGAKSEVIMEFRGHTGRDVTREISQARSGWEWPKDVSHPEGTLEDADLPPCRPARNRMDGYTSHLRGWLISSGPSGLKACPHPNPAVAAYN